MLIDIIAEDAEKKLVAFVEKVKQHNYSWGALYFKTSQLSYRLTHETVLPALGSVLKDNPAAVYFFHNGDIVVCWSGVHRSIVEALYGCFYHRILQDNLKDIETYYDLQSDVDSDLLLQRCRQELKLLQEKMAAGKAEVFHVTAEQVAMFKAIAKARILRPSPEILIVEDQLFSAKLLSGVLEHMHKTYIAPNAKSAWELYLNHAPDIVFLDVEMPGTNGHQFAEVVRRFDEDAYIIMVTGNHDVADIVAARNNRVNGYIVKPYGKKKVTDAIDKYKTERHSNQRGNV
ncbi:MAG TPA: response regulator [Rickettsiales bacterium]|nr:response regulator [Rickettsiales bacterium]